MSWKNRAVTCLVCVSWLTIGSPVFADSLLDADTGMVIDEHWELVKAHCTVCHSAAQFTQQRGSRETWQGIIRWMQETQGLWQFDVATEANILDYLEANYPPSITSRRPPLPADLMPPPAAAGGEESV